MQNNEEFIPHNFFDLIDKGEFVDNIPAGDTDSVYLYVEDLDFTKISLEDIVKAAEELGDEINLIISDFNVNFLLSKLNIEKQYDFTDFKNELVADSFMTLNVKKNYAYRELIFDKNSGKFIWKIKYKGIPVIRSDYSEAAKDFISRLMNDVVFNDELLNNRNLMLEKSNIILNDIIDNVIQKSIDSYDFSLIGKPCKWNTGYKKGNENPHQVLSGKLFNTILDDIILTPMSAFRYIPINIENEEKYRINISKLLDKNEYYISSDIKLKQINNLGIPFDFKNTDLLKEKMNKFSIKPDYKKILKSVYTDGNISEKDKNTSRRIIDCINSIKN